jgi:DNA-binding PadR family transcriptional regulator
MKTIELKNKDLANIYQMLDKLEVEKYKNKRGKGKLQRNIKAKHEEYAEDLRVIQDEHFKKDDEGNYKQEPNAQGVQVFVWLDKWKDNPEQKKKANEATNELADEVAVIDIVENETKIKAFFDAVKEDEFTTKDGFKDEPFDILMDALEATFEKENE